MPPLPAMLHSGDALLRHLFLNWLFQSTLLLGLALLAARLPRVHAGIRHGILVGALALSTAAPLSLLAPASSRTRLEPAQWARPAAPAAAPGRATAADARRAPSAAAAIQARMVPLLPLGWLLLGGWALGCGWRLCALWAGMKRVQRLALRGHRVERGRLYEACRYSVADLPVLESEAVPVPGVIGALQPAILLPAGLAGALEDRALGHVLLHEEAHARRHDPLWLLLGETAHAALYWHPLAAPARRAMDRAAEDACDARVLSQGQDPLAYARTLLAVAQAAFSRSASRVSCPLGSSPSDLRRRVGVIVGGSTAGSPAMAVLAVGAVTASAGATALVEVGRRPALPRAQRPVSGRMARVEVKGTPAPRPPRRRVPPPLPASIIRRAGSPGSAAVSAVYGIGRMPDAPELERVEGPDGGAGLAEPRSSTPREGRVVVFLLDISRTMRAHRTDARQRIVRWASDLGPADRFNVVAFSGEAHPFAPAPLPNDGEAMEELTRWMEALPETPRSSLTAGVERALATPELSSVVVLSDSRCLDDRLTMDGALQLIARRQATARLLAFRLGSGPSAEPLLEPGLPAPAAPQPRRVETMEIAP